MLFSSISERSIHRPLTIPTLINAERVSLGQVPQTSIRFPFHVTTSSPLSRKFSSSGYESISEDDLASPDSRNDDDNHRDDRQNKTDTKNGHVDGRYNRNRDVNPRSPHHSSGRRHF